MTCVLEALEVVCNESRWPQKFEVHCLTYALSAVQHRILYNNVVSIFWNAFLSTLSHAPTIEPTSFMDSFQQYADNLPQPLHERAAEFVDSIYKTSLPLHERAAEFADSLKLPMVSRSVTLGWTLFHFYYYHTLFLPKGNVCPADKTQFKAATVKAGHKFCLFLLPSSTHCIARASSLLSRSVCCAGD